MTLGWWPQNPVQIFFPREILLAQIEVTSQMLLVILIASDFWSMARKVTKSVLCQVLYDYLLRCWPKNVSRKIQHYAAVLIKGLMRKADNFPNHPSSSTNPIQNLSAHHPAGPILLYGGYEKHKVFFTNHWIEIDLVSERIVFTGFWGHQPEVIVPDFDTGFSTLQSHSNISFLKLGFTPAVTVIQTFDFKTQVHTRCDLRGDWP